MSLKSGKMVVHTRFSWLFIIILVSACSFAEDYYLANESCNDSWSGNETHPWCTFSHAFDTVGGGMSGGDTLILKNGTYFNNTLGKYENYIIYYMPPNGTEQNYTTIKAEHDGGVIISGGNFTSPLAIIERSYIQIEGIDFQSSTTKLVEGNYIKIKRCGFNGGYHFGNVVNFTDFPHMKSRLYIIAENQEEFAFCYGSV